jgi:hypothetical protein
MIPRLRSLNMAITPFQSVSGIALLLLSACASTSSEIDMTSVRTDQRVAVGRITVFHNGENYTPFCELQYDDDPVPIKMGKDGLVYRKISGTEIGLATVRCNAGGWYHYKFEPVIPIHASGTENTVSYFGDVEINWDFQGGLKASQLLGPITTAIFDHGNDGKLTYTVKDNFKATVGRFHAEHGKAVNARYVKSILPPMIARLPAAATGQ